MGQQQQGGRRGSGRAHCTHHQLVVVRTVLGLVLGAELLLELSMMENPQGMWQRTHDAEIQGTKQACHCLLAASGSVKGKNSLAKSQAQYLHCRVIFLSPEGCCTNTACSWKGLNTFCIPGVRHSTGLASQPLPTGILLFNNLDFNNLNH